MKSERSKDSGASAVIGTNFHDQQGQQWLDGIGIGFKAPAMTPMPWTSSMPIINTTLPQQPSNVMGFANVTSSSQQPTSFSGPRTWSSEESLGQAMTLDLRRNLFASMTEAGNHAAAFGVSVWEPSMHPGNVHYDIPESCGGVINPPLLTTSERFRCGEGADDWFKVG